MTRKAAKPIVGRHIVRYGIAPDQKYLVGDFLKTYDQLVLNATMVAHMSDALASFIMQRTRYKPFFIDPQTHAFQHDISHLQSSSNSSKGEIKKSFRTLLESYGEPVQTIIGEEHRSVVPKDFEENNLVNEFCERVLDFQIKTLAIKSKSSAVSKYYEFLKKKGKVSTTNVRPSFVVAPYFCMQGNTLEKWLDINKSCAQNSAILSSKKKIPLAIQIVITKDILLDSQQIKIALETYSSLKPDIFLIWVDNFSEQQSSESSLKGFVQFIKGLNQIAPVVNLYGGFFSILLVQTGILAGSTHSLEYGEQRRVVPVSGGVPVAKYYLPRLHLRLAFRTALRAVRALKGMRNCQDFYKNICDCSQCKKVITNNPSVDFAAYGKTKVIRRRQYPTPQTKNNSVRHYMWCKQKEYKSSLDIKNVQANLKKVADTLDKEIGTENTEHCRIWSRVISEVV
ncbi:MAG TPA: hypothetical protein VMW72_23155 [Sedimentisphaerales bacterium]|nr:hypothetical protein [Sedimentisphaerales bacterium]